MKRGSRRFHDRFRQRHVPSCCNKRHPMLRRHLVVATDESAAGRSAVRGGLDLAERALARLTVMRVVPIESMSLLGSVVGGIVGPGGAAAALERFQGWVEAELR